MSITKEQAMELVESEFWKDMDYRQRAEFQMWAERLCMPFDVFHEAVEKALERPVYSHEFGLDWQGVSDELHGDRETPDIDEILELVPEDKRIILIRDSATS